ncbi:MAG: hypothetical protein P8J78_05765 [Maricaulis sp.]|jgi:hypothetical protein|nr:hypothetical protein [Maricaulis sp.]MDG2044097.1 hypothetical protein [Maricaulis sp.]
MDKIANWFRRNFQIITALAAMAVSVIALFVAWDQSRVMRAQQHGAVIPALQIDGFVSGEGRQLSVGVNVFNNGVGPAFVESVEVYRNGVRQDSLAALLEGMGLDTRDRSWTSMVGRVMAPGQTIQAARFQMPMDSVSAAQIAEMTTEFSRWETRICYCSVFDRCWSATSQNARPSRVDQCEPGTIDVFGDLGISAPGSEDDQ